MSVNQRAPEVFQLVCLVMFSYMKREIRCFFDFQIPNRNIENIPLGHGHLTDVKTFH